MIEAYFAIPMHQRKRIASALESGLLAVPYSASSIQSILGTRDDGEAVASVLAGLDRMAIAGAAAAAFLRALESAASRYPHPDLVWSGPEVPGVHARDTRRVYEELLGSAESSVWASTFAYFDGPRMFELLGRRMDERPDLRVTLLLNIQRRRGDDTTADDLVRKFAERFWKIDWPGKRKPRIYFDPRSLDPNGPGGVLHAKAVVSDDMNVFITSANLTEAAFDHNFEIGLLVRDRALALSVSSYFRILIDNRLLQPLPEY
ncbi:MAG: phospholipase [Planctomycetes bacterium]|nr:phospholipase [Planctomycetota bacterium]